MAETYPVPQYEFKDVVKPERRPEIFEVSSERIGILADLIKDDMDSFQEITIGQNADKDWSKIFRGMSEYPEAEIDLIEEQSGIPVTDIEKDMIEAFWGMGANFENDFRHRVLSQEYQKAKEQNRGDEMTKIADKVNKLNIESVAWQNKVVNTLFALSRGKEGKEFLKYFWSNFENIGNNFFANDPELVKSSKQGILGLAKAIEIFEKLGIEAYSSYPEQDAIKKIDLWAKRGNDILAVQVKAKSKKYTVTGGLVTAYESLSNYPDREKREIAQRNQLLTSSQEYDKLFKQEGVDCQVHAYWLDLPGEETELSQDPIMGTVIFPPDFMLSTFVSEIEYDLRKLEKEAENE